MAHAYETHEVVQQRHTQGKLIPPSLPVEDEDLRRWKEKQARWQAMMDAGVGPEVLEQHLPMMRDWQRAAQKAKSPKDRENTNRFYEDTLKRLEDRARRIATGELIPKLASGLDWGRLAAFSSWDPLRYYEE